MKLQDPTNEPTRHSLPPALIHDMRTPLNQIIGYSEMLADRARDVGQTEFIPDLEKVSLAGQRLLGIVERNFGATESAASEPYPAEGQLAAGTLSRSSSHPTAEVENGPDKAEGHLLVVDDDEGNRDVLSQRLTRQGYAVSIAQNGRQALEMLEAGNFDLVLLDIMMPEIDGYEVLHRLKANDRLRNIPVIMISALSEMESVARCIEMGAEDYLTKPFNAMMLKARLGACLEKKRSRDREVVLHDELQVSYKKLQDLEKIREDLTNMIVHDLRTPLTSIIAAIETLDVVGSVNTGQREITDIALTESNVLLGMINSMLDVEKFESGAMELDYTLISVPEVIASALAQIAPLAATKKIALIQKIPIDLPWLNADENKLQRVLVNLMGNALKFTPAGGSITLHVSAAVGKDAVEFCVDDTGEGIPADAFQRIFEKFGQVGSRSGGRSTGTGLGLTFCKLAVEAHGGEIVVESTPGHGSSFCFSIPLAAAHS